MLWLAMLLLGGTIDVDARHWYRHAMTIAPK